MSSCMQNLQAENVIVRTYGEPREEDGLRNHVDLVQLLDIVDLEAGTSVAGVNSESMLGTWS
jgi:seryl-tRNA synthetase